MSNIQSLTDNELEALYTEVNDELGRRRRKRDIPEQISGLAQEGREIGVDESQLLEAVTTIHIDKEASEL